MGLTPWLLQVMDTLWLFAALACLMFIAALWLFVGMCYAAEIWHAWRSR